MHFLGIESSCDETSAAVISDGRLRSNIVSSQLGHRRFGGVVPELASRTHLKLIVPVVEEGKADTVAIVDTRGSALPAGFGWQISQVKKMVKVPIEIHCHNTWGLSTANTLTGITAGAEIAHTCINGMGGNASLDEIIMGILPCCFPDRICECSLLPVGPGKG